MKENSKAEKPLGFEWFREKKLGGKRLYYLIYEKSNTVLLVAFGGKKDQQKIIAHILQNKKLLEKVSSKSLLLLQKPWEKMLRKKVAINILYTPQKTFGKSFIKKSGNKYTLYATRKDTRK